MNFIKEFLEKITFSPKKNGLKKSLSHRVIKGGFWVFSLRIIHRIFSLARLIILARLLSPNDFGLMGIALLAMMSLETFSKTGFQEALIQKKEKTEEYLDAAWSFMLLRNILLFAVLFFAAPYIAGFFDSPKAMWIIRIIGISLLFGGPMGIGGFANIGVVYFQKELKFNKQFIYQLSGTLADFVVAVSAAIILKSVWALVFGLLAGNLVKFFVGYLIHPYRPHLNFDLSKAKELFGFGKWILGSSILIFLITQGDDIFVGKLLGTAALGFYLMAYKISNMPATEITHTISQVTFPAYSKLQDNIPKLREAYLKVLQVTAFLSFPIAGLIFVLAPDFTRLFLGQKWMPMVPAMQVLVLAGLTRSIAATTGPVFYASGRPKIDTRWQMVRLFVVAALIYPFTMRWGIVGTAVAVFLSIFVSNIGFSFNAITITKCGIKNFSRIIVFPLMNGIVMVVLIFVLKKNININGFFAFFSLTGISVLIYLGITYLFDRYFNYGMQLLMRENSLKKE